MGGSWNESEDGYNHIEQDEGKDKKFSDITNRTIGSKCFLENRNLTHG